MSDKMTFPETWEEFEKSYGFIDSEEIYTNGSRLIPSFRVKQWLDHEESKRENNQQATISSDCIERAIHQLKMAVPIAVTMSEFNDFIEAVSMAIEALKKQIPKEFKMVDDTIPICPVCGEEVWDMEWCNNCGQRLHIYTWEED